LTSFITQASTKLAMSNPRPSLGVRCSKSILHTDNLYVFYHFESDVLMQVVLSATSSRLLSLQLGFKCFQYVSLS